MMPATSVKMDAADKARLDRLQALLTARTGCKVTQQELLARLVDLGQAEMDRLAGGPPKGRKPDLRLLRSLPMRGGGPTREEDIDRDLYGTGGAGAGAGAEAGGGPAWSGATGPTDPFSPPAGP